MDGKPCEGFDAVPDEAEDDHFSHPRLWVNLIASIILISLMAPVVPKNFRMK
jgi:hypothetical protein